MTNEPDSTVEYQIFELPTLDAFRPPPEVSNGEVRLDLGYANWDPSSLEPPKALERLKVGRGNPVRIATTHMPVTVHLRVTDSLTDSGLPDVEQQSVWECEQPAGQPCKLSQADAPVLLEINEANDPDVDARYVILHIEWVATDEEQTALRLSARSAFDREADRAQIRGALHGQPKRPRQQVLRVQGDSWRFIAEAWGSR